MNDGTPAMILHVSSAFESPTDEEMHLLHVPTDLKAHSFKSNYPTEMTYS